MGLAAGQARLLSITARLTDNENNAQALSYSKQRLADQTEQVNTEYNNALNATKLTVLTGFNGSVANYEDISYNLMTGYNTVACGKQYVVTDAKGQILVSDKIAKAFEDSNGDFNKFLKHNKVSVNGKTNFSQVDIDTKLAGKTDAEKAEINQKVHDAWDKYFQSVGLSFVDNEHDTANPDVKFGYMNTYDEKGNVTGGYPYYELNTPAHYTATFNNDDGNGNPLIKDLPAGNYKLTQRLDSNGEPEYAYPDENGKNTAENAPYYTFVATDNNGESHTYTIRAMYYSQVPGSSGQLTYSKDDDEIGIFDADLNKITNETLNPATTKSMPINYDGTTKEQRDLYDYAVALTEAVANQQTNTGNPVSSIYADSENAGIITYLKNIFNQMQQFGYTTVKESYHLEESDTLQKNSWFEDQLQKGKLFLKGFSSSENDFVQTSISSDSAIQEVQDERKIALAEAKYTQDTAALESKDEKIDLELKKLDTEHSALQTEYDSLKSVVSKNIEKSFNIFS